MSNQDIIEALTIVETEADCLRGPACGRDELGRLLSNLTAAVPEIADRIGTDSAAALATAMLAASGRLYDPAGSDAQLMTADEIAGACAEARIALVNAPSPAFA